MAECRPKRLWRQYQFIPFRGSYEAGLDALLRRLAGEPVSPFPPSPSLPRPTAPDRRIHEKTGIELVRVPAGPFLYGNDKRTVDLPEFWIGRYPVTNKQYKHFLDANPDHRVPYYEADWARSYNRDEKRRAFPTDKAYHPVVLVSWEDAREFCVWAGLALPTEEQWEKAARGIDGRFWPWGAEPPTHEHCNFNRNVGSTTPLGKYSPRGDSPCGCADMAGNVWEWTGTWYAEEPKRALRGGAWSSTEELTRAAFRDSVNPDVRSSYVGFRVVELLSDPDF